MERSDIQVALSRDLSLFDITMIGIAGMIGAGIFALTGIASGIAGPAILIAFFLNGIIATLTGMAYAELGSAIPQAGGGYLWIREAMGDYAGFITGWIDWAAHTIACALYAVTFGAFFSEFVVRFAGLPVSQVLVAKLSAFLIVTFLAYVNYVGVKESGKFGGVVTLLKIAILLVFAFFGIYKTFTYPDWMKSYTPFMPTGIAGVLTAMGLTFIAFEGFEIIVQSGEEVKNPERNIPKAIVISLWTAVAIYILVAFSLLGAVKADVPSWQYLGKLGEFSLIRVADSIMPFGGIMIIAGGLISTISAMNATIYSSSRVVFALSRTGYLNRRLSEVNEKTKTPHYAIFFSYLIIAFASLAPIETVAGASSLMFILLFLTVNLSLILLRLRRPDLKRSFKMPLVPLLPMLAIAFQAIITYFLVTHIENGSLVFLAVVAWIFAGSFLYYAYSEKELTKRIEEEIKTVYKEIPPVEKRYRILVPVANPVIARKLVRFAELIARKRDGEIIIMNTVTLPLQTPITAKLRDIESAKDFVSQIISETSVPSGGVVKVGHYAHEAILNVVDEVKPDLLIMGWRGRTFRRDAVLGSTIDPIMVRADCDVLIVRFQPGKELNTFRRILIPTAGGPHARLACEVARDIVRGDHEIKLLYVGKKEKERVRAEKAFKEAMETLEGMNVTSEFTVSSDPAGKIAAEAEKFDAVLIGASERPFIENFLLGLFPEKIVSRTSRTVVMTRKWVRLVK
ncbi:amino acid permease [Geoglobus sp.]